jgi:hypothetical protein
LGYTFLPCVLVGLSRAPQFVSASQATAIQAQDVDAVIIPASACGGSAILSFSQDNAKIITVAENTTTLQITAEHLGIKTIPVNSYLEALGVVACDRAGISHHALSPSILPLHCLSI